MTLEEAKYVLDQFDEECSAIMRWSVNPVIPRIIANRMRQRISDALEVKVLEEEIASSFVEVSRPR